MVIALLIVSLAGCVRSIPTQESLAPGTTVPGTAEPGAPGSTQGPLDEIYQFATQTAIAAQGGVIPTAPVAAETPGAPTTETAPKPTAPSDVQPTQPVAPTDAPVLVVPTATPGIPTSYTLQKGEFPYCIARRFNVDPGELLRMNNLTGGSVFFSGMVLTIPQTGRPFPGSRSLVAHPTTFTVGASDTIYSVACVFGDVSPEAIAFANNLTPPYKLSAGQILNIP
jgi:LysM repeat protein